jgi:hypothetical protein
MSRQSGWNVGIETIDIDGDSITVGIKRQGHSMLGSATCRLLLSEPDSGWSNSVFVDISSGAYAPILSIVRPEVIESGSLVTAEVSCESPWNLDDDPNDDTSSAIAGAIPLVEFGSGDVVWTISVATILIGIAWLGGIIGTRRDKPIEKQSVPTKSKEPVKKIEEIPIDDSEIDDMSLDDLDDLIEEIPEIEIEEEIKKSVVKEIVEHKQIIEDSSASGKLGALRREIATDDDDNTEKIEEEDLNSRMDRFFSER